MRGDNASKGGAQQKQYKWDAHPSDTCSLAPLDWSINAPRCDRQCGEPSHSLLWTLL